MLGAMLLVSLVLNLFFAGILVGRLQHRPQSGGESKAEWIIERMASTLPGDDGKVLRTVFQTHQAMIGKLTADLQASRDEVRQVLRMEPFDQQALQAAFAQVRQRRQAVHEAVHEVLIEAVPLFSSQGRRKLSEWRREGR
jgi:uncharacterized membrane protein